jgi:sulfatase maturation enzyme AslB (radical SAM superfamily)
MFSKYLRTRERDGMVAVFHELHPDPVYITADDWSAYCSGEILNNLLDSQLRERKLVISEMSDDDRAFATAESLVLGKLQHTTILYLMTAQGCNADCGYCPVQDIAKRYGASLLTVEAARAGIDLWQLHLEDVFDDNRDYYVIFYGGEPLLNKPVIEESLRYLESQKISGKLPKRVQYMVATNGLLIDDEFVRLCLEYRMSVAVGLDGDARANDALKIDIAGQPTFSRITEAVRKLVTAGISTHASCSITPFNFEQVEEMSDLFRNIGVRKFGFNFLRGQKLVELVGQDGVESYYRQASKAIIRHARVQSEPGFEFQMEKKALAYTRGDFFPLDCTCYGSQLVIQPDGQVSNCPFFKARLGDVQKLGTDFRIGDQSIVQEWRRRLPIYHSNDAKALSGGGCAWGMVDQNLNPSVTDIGSRIFSEEVLDEFIWNTYRVRS